MTQTLSVARKRQNLNKWNGRQFKNPRTGYSPFRGGRRPVIYEIKLCDKRKCCLSGFDGRMSARSIRTRVYTVGPEIGIWRLLIFIYKIKFVIAALRCFNLKAVCLKVIQAQILISCLQFFEDSRRNNYEGESNINGNFAVDCTKHVRT